jgi:hypothetical protein
MSQRDKATLKALFQTGDAPTGSDFEDLIDSSLNLAETSVQTVAGQIDYSGGATFATISAATVGGAQGTFTAMTVTAASIITLSSNNISGLARAEMYRISGGTCAFAALSAFMTLSAITTSADSAILQQFSHSGSGKLTYVGTATKVVEVVANFDTLSVTGRQLFAVRIGVNGTTLERSEISFNSTTVAGTPSRSGDIGCMVTLTTNSFIEVFAAAQLNVSDIVFTKLNLRIREA